VQIDQYHIVDASSEEEECTLAKYVAICHSCPCDTASIVIYVL